MLAAIYMIIGIPNGLLYFKYKMFLNTFFKGLGASVITSPSTNAEILDLGIKYCVDEACLPIKIFHGHAAYIRNKCDIMLIPRIMQIEKNEFICPKFCGLPEMIKNNIPNMPPIISEPIYAFSKKSFRSWINHTGRLFTKNIFKINHAYDAAIDFQNQYEPKTRNNSFPINIALVGHPYNIYDNFANMNVIKKLQKLGIGVITEEYIKKSIINKQSSSLFKKPFWTFERNSYGFSTYMAEQKNIDGIVYVSSFACGIDSIVIELIKDQLDSFPILVLKIDEQTGEAGFNTRLEAFSDMLKRRCV